MSKIRTIVWLTVSALILSIGSVQASEVNGEWTINISVGPGFTLAPETASDLHRKSMVVGGDLAYMVNEHFGLVPASFTIHRFVYDKDKILETSEVAKQLPGNPSTFSVSASGWGFAFTPGLLLSTSSESVRGFAQLGLGLYHHSESVEILKQPDDKNFNKFAALLGGGAEVPLTDKASFVGQARYQLIATDDESTSLLGVLGSVKYYF